MDKTLSPLQKMLVAEIDSLSEEDEGCTASNAYLASFFEVTEGRMANMITELRKLGVIETSSFDGRQRTLKVKAAFTKNVNSDIEDREGRVHGNREVPIRGENKEESMDDFALEPEVLKNGEKRRADSLFKDKIPPDWFKNPEFGIAWKGFLDHRKALKATVTDIGVTRLMNQMREWGIEKSIRSLHKTIDSGKWTGLYDPDERRSNGSKPEPRDKCYG